MGIAERREREKEQRRNMILDAAERLFFGKGAEATTMDDVAELAELSKGTLYLYFKSKDDILHAIHLRGLTILRGLFEEAVASQQRGIDKVRAIGDAYYIFSEHHADYFNAMTYFEGGQADLGDPHTFAYQCHQCSESVMKIVADAVKTGIADGTIRPELDPMKTAYLLWAQTTGVIQMLGRNGDHLEQEHGFSAEDLVPAMFDFIGFALANPAAGPD